MIYERVPWQFKSVKSLARRNCKTKIKTLKGLHWGVVTSCDIYLYNNIPADLDIN
jgi:hypothetical protein